jgi:hypothetical protein
MNGIFDFKAALRELNGTMFSLRSLQIRLSEIRLRNLADVPPEIGVRELIELGLDRKWIIEDETGAILVEVSEEEFMASM